MRRLALAVVISLGHLGLAQSTCAADEAGRSIETPLEITESGPPKVAITATDELYISLGRTGGAFFWAPSVRDENVLQIRFVKSITKLTAQSPIVGLPQFDIFMVRGNHIGETDVRFDLRTARGAPIRSIDVLFQVLGKGGEK